MANITIDCRQRIAQYSIILLYKMGGGILCFSRKDSKSVVNIAFAINTHGISKSQHIEKVMLLYDGSGKDKISDLTVNLIKGFLCEYTENFALQYLDEKFLEKFPVDKAYY